ncbi:MAG: hypothetical protein H0V14_03290 [Chitinophagaceae bacterium]|nr:hypothetical protein [Chitinophagaceae bacterium]
MLLTITEFIGRFHPVLVHLPIGFLLIGLLLQWLSSKEKYHVSKEVIKVVILSGMITAILACITGYFLSLSGDYDEDLIDWHMWMGIGVAAISILYYAKISYGQFDISHKILSVALFFFILITGHLGGSLTHGPDYIFSALNADHTDTIKQKAIADIQQAVVYADVVQPILQQRCYTCHGPKKQKGGLRMDDFNFLMKGSKEGKVIIAGNATESDMIKRLQLPKEDDDHMPPRQKPQLNEKQIVLIHWWVENGADAEKKVKDIPQPEKIKPYLLALQTDHAEHKAPPNIPQDPVEKANEKAVEQLKNRGVIVMPVAQNSNYIMANFVTASGINNKDFSLLLPLKEQLIWLKVGDTKISDSALVYVAQCTNITFLQLHNTNVTDKGLSLLKSLDKLQSLNLVATNVTANGVIALKDLNQLNTLYLYKTKVDKKDWEQLKKEFPKTILDSGGYVVPLLPTDTIVAKPQPVK